ncbi:proline-rich small protein YnaL [Escherichia coli]
MTGGKYGDTYLFANSSVPEPIPGDPVPVPDPIPSPATHA